MDLDLSDEQRDLEEATRDVLEGEETVQLSRNVVEEKEGAAKAVDDLWSRLVALDWPALTVPEEFGGLGLGVVELAVVTEQLGRSLAPGPFLSTASQFVTAIRVAGSDVQQKKFLEPVARDGTTGSFALAEPGGTFDLDGIGTTFRAMRGSYLLDGVKGFVLEPTRAKNIVVAARQPDTSGSAGLGLFVVPSDDPNVEIQAMNVLDATREIGTVTLSNVRVEGENVLGNPGQLAPAITRVLLEATTALSAEMVGTCQGIVDILLGYVKEREQFGVKIGSFQAIKHKLANMYVTLEATRASVRFAAAAIDENDPRAELAVSMAKSAVGDCERLIGVEGIQCLGGIGYTWEHDMHLYVKRIRTGAALFGTGAQHRAKVADLIGLNLAD
ncbi:MAG: acyl-CoA dehydrogenase family protein [Acidimicrobiales bacterium]